jgi:hypothetical protein
MLPRQLTFQDYYNTVKEEEPTVRAYKEVARGQDAAVLWLFAQAQEYMDYPELAPSHIHSDLIGKGRIGAKTPLTSIRRSITNLTKHGLLERTNKKQIGAYGRSEFAWRLTQ